MSRNQRIGLVVGALIVAIVAFVVAQPGDDDDSTPSSSGTQTQTQTTPDDGSATETETTRIEIFPRNDIIYLV